MDLYEAFIINFIVKGIDICLKMNVHTGAVLLVYFAIIGRSIWPHGKGSQGRKLVHQDL